jgi:DNA mismatch repair protein MutL
MSPERVDVNVHPTKAEVRFLEQSLVHEVLRRALGEALGAGPSPEFQFRVERALDGGPLAQSIPGILAGATVGSRWIGAPNRAGEETEQPRRADEPSGGAQAGSPEVRPMIPLGQFRDTFIIAIDDEGVAIIDQHVAHERILFEQVMEKLTAGHMEGQRLLTPMLLDLSAPQRQALAASAEALSRFGFELEEFGGGSVRIAEVPALLVPSEYEAAIRALAEDLQGLDKGSRVEDALKRIAATTACHAAVKANYPLTREKMQYILDELRRTAYSTVCPHGRPVVLRLTRREIEKNFQRI